MENLIRFVYKQTALRDWKFQLLVIQLNGLYYRLCKSHWINRTLLKIYKVLSYF